MVRRRLLLLALGSFIGALGIGASGIGCLSPTLPLPPPEEPDGITESAPGTWEVRGSCDAGAQVVVVNQKTGRGAVYVDLEARGRYFVSIEGAPCDLATISQAHGEEASGETRFILTPREAGLDSDPSACSP